MQKKRAIYNIKYSCISWITVVAIDFGKLDKSCIQLFTTLYHLIIAVSKKLDQPLPPSMTRFPKNCYHQSS